ncbi:DUF4099 domain-containing protein [Mucilaginibacter sp. KACC 22773]|uniref:DUF4099 domain-containing protein n=1 Tax=Mucilaginibacter sp. KACC 22773 TaxID=3025671 RepID=UPI00236627BA|nr:DUF4099 domain-containing protein [Mucilaginibacter sp. KACC 22773]WDF80763.1 DUF4099 domain-containing protein [Mucilaginibacter sp. KACC 22773]
MFQKIFEEEELPLADLQKIGLAGNGHLNLNEKDLTALLSGNRTGMLRLENIETDGLRIPALDAKLSLRPNTAGNLDLLVHPIYREADIPDYLTDTEAEELEQGEIANVGKTINDHGVQKEVLIEFDPDTREFIITDTEKILVPDMVNDELLTLDQKERYRKGKEVQLQDGTAFRFSATSEDAVRANKIGLIVSVVLDGGISYILFKGLNALFNKKRDEKDAADLSTGYLKAKMDLDELQTHKGHDINSRPPGQYHRGYTYPSPRR